MTQSFDFPDDILIGCKVNEYRCRIVDANVKGVLPREVAQEAMVPMNSFLVEGCGQGDASIELCHFRADRT